MKIIKCILAFILFTLVGAGVAYLLYRGFVIAYPFGLHIQKWLIVLALLFFSFIYFFTLILLVDLLELFCAPIRRLGGRTRVTGMGAIIFYAIACVMSLYVLWIKYYKFHFTGLGDIEWIKFVMAIILSLVTISTFGICINSAWGPKDLSSGQSS